MSYYCEPGVRLRLATCFILLCLQFHARTDTKAPLICINTTWALPLCSPTHKQIDLQPQNYQICKSSEQKCCDWQKSYTARMHFPFKVQHSFCRNHSFWNNEYFSSVGEVWEQMVNNSKFWVYPKFYCYDISIFLLFTMCFISSKRNHIILVFSQRGIKDRCAG